MQITINGEGVEVPQGISLLACLELRELNPTVVVVERNRAIVPADGFSTTLLEEGDILEILHFVGGGYWTSIAG